MIHEQKYFKSLPFKNVGPWWLSQLLVYDLEYTFYGKAVSFTSLKVYNKEHRENLE